MIRYSHNANILAATLLITMCYAMMACTGYSTHNKAEVAQVKKQIELLSDSGVAARKNSLFDKAIQLHNEELKLAESIGDSSSIIGALNNIGTNYRRLGLLEDACRYHMEALKLASRKNQSEKDKKARLMSLNGLGNVYLTMGNYEQADSMFRLSLIGDKELDNKLGQAINLANIGSVKESLGQEDSAWIYYRYSLALNKQAQSKLGEALCFSHFGSLHEKKGMYQEAIEEYKHAYDVIEDSPDDWHKLEAGVNVAKLYIQLGQYQQAQQYLEEVKTTAERIHSLNHQSRIQELYYLLYNKQGNIQAALNSFIKSTEFKDSLYDANKMNQIQNMRINLEREQNRERLQMLDESYQTELLIHRVLTVVLIISLIGTIAIIMRQRNQLRKHQH